MRDELHAYANELLADGEWHDYYQTLTAISRKVLPGEAVRRANSRRTTNVRNRKDNQGATRKQMEQTLKGADTSQLVRNGSRHIAAQLLNSARFEHQPAGRPPPGVKKLVRLRRNDGPTR